MATSLTSTPGASGSKEPVPNSIKEDLAGGNQTHSPAEKSVGSSSSLRSPPQTPVKLDTNVEGFLSTSDARDDTLVDNGGGKVPPTAVAPKPRNLGGRDLLELEGESEEPGIDKSVSYYMRLRSREIETDSIYKAFVNRLSWIDSHRMTARGFDKNSPAPQPSKLVKSVVDYIRVTEDRLQKLEESQADDRNHDLKKKAKSGAKAWMNEDIVLEVRFFHSEGEFDTKGDFQHNIDKKGTYTCNKDPRYLIRALFNWADEAAPVTNSKPPNPSLPNPDDIDVLAFGIHSEPISRFYQERIGVSMEDSHLVKIGKPFRSLLQNLHLLRDQLAKLEEHFGSVNPKTSGDFKPTPSVEDSNKSRDSQADDDIPLHTASNESEALEAFDTYEALGHFRMLIDFVDKYLGKQVSLFKRMKAGHEEKIAFQNLWMLFDTGDTIYCPRREEKLIFDDHSSKAHYVPQAFRVLGCRGGLPLVKTMAPKHAVPDKADIWDMSIAKMLMLDANHLTDALQMPSSQSKKHVFSPLYVVCFNVDFDGVKYGTVREVFMFKPFNGLVGIRDLEVYPVQFLQIAAADPGSPSNQAEVDILVERGRKFIDATKVAHLSYDGLTVGKSREEISSAVMVDFKLAFSEYKDSFQDPDSVVPQFTTLTGPWPDGTDGETYEIYKSTCDDLWCHQEECLVDPYTDFQEDQVEKIEPKVKLLLEEYEPGALQEKEGLEEFKDYMEKHDLIRLLPGVVPGFALRRRKWVQLDLSQLMPLEQGDDWNKLVLPPGHREMVQAMVETHARGSQDTQQAHKNNLRETEMDLVRGKGKGCIILLHGVPGVGKTSTAECVATYTERPLYPITCGDIGYVPQDVEHNMERHFKLAHKWGCVLLLDEADVFLAKRNKTDVKRNGLVSVFLRILEYYSGILFLTTNRVGAIDDAFRSRLHLTLYYPKLSRKQTNKIWKNNIDRVKTISEERRSRGQLPITYDKKKIMKWVEINWEVLQWNGRQIRNAFQTALALSEFAAKHSGSKGKMSSPKEPVLDVSHFRLIADATTQFNEYLYSVHGGDEEDMAVRDKLRQENFAPMVKLKDVPISSSSSSSDDSSDKDLDDDETEGESDTRKKGKKGKKKVKSQKEKQKQKEKEKKKSKTKKTSKRQSKSSTEDTGEDNEPESEG